MSKYPECDRLIAVSEESNKISEFLDWLSYKHYYIAEECGNLGSLVRVSESIQQLLANYFEIDLKKVEYERRSLLAEARANRGP